MGEWYRGIAVAGSGPSSTDVHDLGPGTYFTDTSGVAKDYAKFRSTDSKWTARPAVLYGNFAEGSLGPVLDLTSGPDGQAWRQFEETSYVGMTNRQIMKTNPERYGPMFKEWVAQRGLNLNQYAAIVGPEYLRGGRQLCIRNPEVADRVIASMVGQSVYAPPPVLPNAISLTYSGRGQANGHIMVAVFAVVDAAANYFNQKFQEAAIHRVVKQDLQSIRDWQAKHPGDGALIAITFRRTVLNSEFMQNKVLIQPGDAFEFSSIYFAPSPEEAVKQMSAGREFVQGDIIDGPYKTVRRKQGIWIAPRGRVEEAALSSPWPMGWWRVWDGNTWYYYLGPNGVAMSSKTSPLNTRTPPAKAHNTGTWAYSTPKTLVITWKQVAGAPKPCKETFWNADEGCEQMNANSNLYSPLVAKRMESS
ncbi:hypothetical protein [Bradyrhizobium diversitatis]|uniref:Uncharacterized protein n=1 Tax=Bradyrhizobium diversitatis TaxID=2755406 RepID=A0ABS0NXW2_9BRAD|nr:hypothetical protein [Bradyrhizobium diversitatis]MBH5385849.1 hypothetical protein [Bradyrhizobium diversitatis]